MHTQQSLHKNSFAKKHFLSKPWNDWWLVMYTALRLTVKQQYGSEWIRAGKSIEDVTWKFVNLLLLIWANSAFNAIETRPSRDLLSVDRDGTGASPLCPSASWPHPSSAPHTCFLLGGGGGGTGVCGWCSNQIQQRSTSQGIWWLRKNKAAAP